MAFYIAGATLVATAVSVDQASKGRKLNKKAQRNAEKQADKDILSAKEMSANEERMALENEDGEIQLGTSKEVTAGVRI